MGTNLQWQKADHQLPEKGHRYAEKGYKETCGGIGMFTILIVVIFSQVYTYYENLPKYSL